MPKFRIDEQQQWVHFAPSELINRQFSEWQGLRADVVTAVAAAFVDRCRALRTRDGETLVEGLPRSTLRNLSGRLTFVPAGHKFYG